MAFDARHFAYWVGGNADWNNVDRDVLDRFARHACSCPRALGGRSKRGNGAVRRRNAARFLAYLVDQGAISRPPEEPELDERLTAFCPLLAPARALSPSGIDATVTEVTRCVSPLFGGGQNVGTKA